MKKTKHIFCLFNLTIGLLSFYGNAQVNVKLAKSIKDKYSFIPSGKIMLNNDSVSIKAFFISKFEVSNAEYKEFYSELFKTNNTESIAKAIVDSSNWNAIGNFKPLDDLYFKNSAYNDYPVVNVSNEGAMLYCKWLSEKLNKENASEGVIYEFRLPTREEWLRAAKGNRKNSTYAWEGNYLRNDQKQVMCNFKKYSSENIHFNDSTNTFQMVSLSSGIQSETIDITSPVKSYSQSVFGLYNMNGNVAEMITQPNIAVGGSWNSTGYDVRNESTINFKKSSIYVGFRPILIVSKK